MNAMANSHASGPLRRLAERAAGHTLWQEVEARRDRFEALMGAPMPPPRALTATHLRRLNRALDEGPACRTSGVSQQQAMSEIESLARELSPAEQSVLYQELLRGLDPAHAFDTYGAEHLFSEAELAAIGQVRSRVAGTRIKLPMVHWAPGKDANYSGYVCAIVKLTRQCNLRCGYCNDWRTGPESRMKFDVMLQVISRLLVCESHAVVDFVWHGGEPTLLGKREFLRILALQAMFQTPGQRLKNRLQTNATAIDAEWASFLADFNFSVSVSLDGPRELHDRSRPMASGRSSYDAVLRGLRLLREHGLGDGVLIVVGDGLVEYGAERLVQFLQSEGLTKVALLALRPSNPPTLSSGPYLSQRTYAKFLIDVHRARLAQPEPWISVRELDVLLKTRAGQMPRLCEHLGNCVGHYYSIESNGDVGHCDKYVGDTGFTLGNVMQVGFDELRASAKVLALRERTEQSRESMKGCKHYAKCRGWCPHERYVAQRKQLGVEAKCCGLGPIFEALDSMEPAGSSVPAAS